MGNVFKVLYVTSNKASLPLADWISKTPDVKVEVFQDKLTLNIIKKFSPDILISYNYIHIIKANVLEYMEGKSINMHISMLPWNKGTYPNFWSFVENTPKGVTIHQIVPGLDAGAIIYQKECFFDTKIETFASTYQKLQDAVQELFKEHWDEIRKFSYSLNPQEGEGSYHVRSQFFDLREQVPFEWSDKISDYLTRYNQYIEGKL